MIVSYLFFMATVACMYAVYKAMLKNDHQIAYFQVVWIYLISVWLEHFTPNYNLVLTQSVWCLWSIHGSMLLTRFARRCYVPFWVFILPTIPFVLDYHISQWENAWAIVRNWSVLNIIASISIAFMMLRMKSFTRFQIGIFLLGYWASELTWLIGVWHYHVEVNAILVAWYFAESIFIATVGYRCMVKYRFWPFSHAKTKELNQ